METRGRKTKLTPELHNELVQYLEQGNYVETAVVMCGIVKDTFYNWMKKGNNAKSGKYKAFSDAVKKSQWITENRHIENIEKHAFGLHQEVVKTETGTNQFGTYTKTVKETKITTNWQASAWRLERMCPGKYGRKVMNEVTGAEGKPIQIEGGGLAGILKATESLEDSGSN